MDERNHQGGSGVGLWLCLDARHSSRHYRALDDVPDGRDDQRGEVDQKSECNDRAHGSRRDDIDGRSYANPSFFNTSCVGPSNVVIATLPTYFRSRMPTGVV